MVRCGVVGRGAITRAGAVVTQSVPPAKIVARVPAKEARKIAEVQQPNVP